MDQAWLQVAWVPAGWAEARPDGGFGHGLSRASTHPAGCQVCSGLSLTRGNADSDVYHIEQ